jgi:PHD/YefM family antitoxin component YafN of YafNO toxin-antitoxin module
VSIELTEEQQRAIDASPEAPPRVVDPRSKASYVLLSTEDYEAVREMLEEERKQQAIRAIGLRNAGGRMAEAQ